MASDWEGTMGLHDDEDIERITALERLNNPGQARNYDATGRGYGSDRQSSKHARQHCGEDTVDNNNSAEMDENECIAVKDLSFDAYRNRLVSHFDIAFKKREVKWPKRNSKVQPNV